MMNRTFTLTRARRNRRRGSALIEFALIVILFLSMLVGMLQYGVYLNATNTLWNLSREGARYAAVQKSSNGGANQAIIDRVKEVAPPQINKSLLDVTVTPADNAARTPGTSVTVTLSYDMSSKLFVPTPLAKNYTTYSTMYVE